MNHMKRWVAVLLVSALFVLGIVAGALATHLAYSQRFRERRGGLAELGHGRFAERLERELELTPEQRRGVDRILGERRDQAEALRREFIPRFDALMEGASDRIEELLTPEQRQGFKALRADQRRRSERFLGRGHRGPGGPPGPPDPGGPPGPGPGPGPPLED